MNLDEMKLFYEKHSLRILKITIGLIFLYYGITALLDPTTQGNIWIVGWMRSIITIFIPLNIFMIIFGLLETLVGLMFIANYKLRYFSPIAAALLLGIIASVVQLDTGILLRDIVIFSAVLLIWSKTD